MKAETLSRNALNRALLARQMLLEREAITVEETVARLVALQAQQAQPPFVGLWTRITGFAREALLTAIRDKKIVRATFLRGTLHLTNAADFLLYRGTLQPMLTAGMQSVLRDRAKDLDMPALVAAAHQFFQQGPATFTELRNALVEQFPDADERALGYAVRTHLPLVAAPDGSTWGFGPDPSFAESGTWLGKVPDATERTEALVLRYLAAFGPAAATDVQAWSGLKGARAVLDALRPQLQVFRDERKRELFDLPDAPRPDESTPVPVRFLPGFDNAILAHDDRSRIIADDYRPIVTTKNLQVLPTFLVDGFVAGTWKAARTKTTATLTLTPFVKLSAPSKKRLAEEGESLARFLEPDAKQVALAYDAP